MPCLPQGSPCIFWVGRPDMGLLGRQGGPVSSPCPHSWSRFLGDLPLLEGQTVLAAPSGAGSVLVPVRFPCASRPCSFVHWLEQGNWSQDWFLGLQVQGRK